MRLSWIRGVRAPALEGAVSLGFGIFLGTTLPIAPGAWFLGALFLLGAVLSLVSPPFWNLGICVALFVSGLYSGRHDVLEPRSQAYRFAAALDENDLLEVRGTLTEVWSRSGSSRRTSMAVEACRLRNRTCDLTGTISLFAAGATEAYQIAGLGDTVRVSGPLRAPSPVSGDENLLDLAPPRPVLYLKSARQIEKLMGPRGFSGAVRRIHRYLHARIATLQEQGSPEENRAIGLFLALFLGETSELASRDITAFRDGGVAHVLAVSGLQVALLVAVAYSFLRSPRVPGVIRDGTMILVALSYAVLAGGAPPVLRSALTLATYFGSRLAGRPTSSWQAVGLSAFLILAMSPESLFDIGFLLSYSAILGLAGIFPEILRLMKKSLPGLLGIPSLLAGTFSAELAVLPIQAYVFRTVPILGLLSNLVVVPVSSAFFLVSLVLLPSLMAGGLCAAVGLAVMTWFSDGMFAFLRFLDGWGPSRLIPRPGFLFVFTLISALAIFCLARSLKVRGVAVVLGAAASAWILFRSGKLPPAGEVTVGMIDVGQGDAWLLQTSQGSVLIDGGGSFDPAADFGRLRLLPQLSNSGAVRFDAVVLTHPHPDHSRGLLSVLSYCQTGFLAISAGAPSNEFLQEILESAATRGIPVSRFGAGDHFRAAGLEFTVLNPDGNSRARHRVNNSSLAMSVAVAGRRLLLTGDMEASAERDLLERGADLKADILKVGHHGSKTSTTPAFLHAVSPRIGLIGVGKRNRFGHPSPDVLESLKRDRVRVFRTDRDGNLSLRIAEGRIFPVFPERGNRLP